MFLSRSVAATGAVTWPLHRLSGRPGPPEMKRFFASVLSLVLALAPPYGLVFAGDDKKSDWGDKGGWDDDDKDKHECCDPR